jgi:hypothetical protein
MRIDDADDKLAEKLVDKKIDSTRAKAFRSYARLNRTGKILNSLSRDEASMPVPL